MSRHILVAEPAVLFALAGQPTIWGGVALTYRLLQENSCGGTVRIDERWLVREIGERVEFNAPAATWRFEDRVVVEGMIVTLGRWPISVVVLETPQECSESFTFAGATPLIAIDRRRDAFFPPPPPIIGRVASDASALSDLGIKF